MKPQHLLLATVPYAIDAFVTQTPSHSFVGRSLNVAVAGSSIYMDTEGDHLDRNTRLAIEKKLNIQSPVSMSSSPSISIEDAEAEHGMPWKTSIDPKKQDELLYMPFWDWQMQFMKDNLSNLQIQPCTSESGETDFSYMDNDKKKARIVNMCMKSDEYRKIRMTYYDAGENTQVFNSVWYPHPSYNLPILGIDLLSFNGKKYLAIVDFQPLHDKEEDHAATYEHILKPIKEKYDSLKGRMSSKFYDETQFFSQQMLFARFEDGNVVDNDLLPAFKSYVETHYNMIQDTNPDTSESSMKFVLNRQKEYDSYSAERDPATGLFAAMFGQEWANEFVHDFLFSLSERTEGSEIRIPPMGPMMGGGGPPPSQQASQKEASKEEKVAAPAR